MGSTLRLELRLRLGSKFVGKKLENTLISFKTLIPSQIKYWLPISIPDIRVLIRFGLHPFP